jgi:hypothetical protein
MLIYDMNSTQEKNRFISKSVHFPNIEGIGITEDQSFVDFMEKIHDELNRRIECGESFPTPIDLAIIKQRKKRGQVNNLFSLSPTVSLKMHLHTLMAKRKVSKALLARLLALTEADVSSFDWSLDKIRDIVPKKAPDYKKTHRLLDVKHNSALQEIEEGFRVLDANLDFVVRPKSLVEDDPIFTFYANKRI